MTLQMQVQDRHVTVNDLTLHYREWGNPAASPLLIFHGITGHAWEFDPVAAALAEQFHVLVVNQRGHGISSWAQDYSPEAMADDIAAIIAALALEHVRIIGHSMGGVNSWYCAARHPELVERLVITDIEPEVFRTDEVITGLLISLNASAQAHYADPEEAVAAYLAGYPGTQQQQQLRIFVINNLKLDTDGRWIWRFDARGLVRWMQYAVANQEAHWTALRRIACPTLVVRAGDSPVTSRSAAEQMVQAIAQAQLVEIPGSGHDIHIDQYAALLAELRPFLLEQQS